MEAEDGVVVVKGRAIIDTRAPFRSVKEAVLLFGEKVLAGEIYAKQLQQMKTKPGITQEERAPSKSWTTTTTTSITTTKTSELDEARQSLNQAREQGEQMAKCLRSLKEELDQTRKELQQIRLTNKNKQTTKYRETQALIPPPSPATSINPEIEEIKFVKNDAPLVLKTAAAEFGIRNDHQDHDKQVHDDELIENKKIVRFASPPYLTRELMYNNPGHGLQQKEAAVLDRAPSFKDFTDQGKKKKNSKKSVFNGWLFPKKKKKHVEG